MNKKDKPFKCPNCGIEMSFVNKIRFHKEQYDEWECEDCSHIIVLDYRGD